MSQGINFSFRPPKSLSYIYKALYVCFPFCMTRSYTSLFICSCIARSSDLGWRLVKQRNNILAFLPKAPSAVTFQVSPPISSAGKGFSAPILSLIPKEAPRKSKNGSFDAREPTSPEVSCMGKIKCKKKKKETVGKLKLASPPPQAFTEEVKIRKLLVMLQVLKGTKRGLKSDVSDAEAEVAESVPSLSQMKQFSSARGTLSDFDWRTGVGCVSNPLYEEKGVKS